MRTTMLRTGSLAGVTVAVLAATAGIAAADDSVTGSAFGASATVSLLPGVLTDSKGITVETGQLAKSASAGPKSASIADVPLKGLVTAKAIASSVVDGAGSVAAKASVAEATLPLLAPVAGRVPSIRLISARCASADGHVTGSSDLANVNLGKLGTLPAATSPNQKLGIPGVAEITVNEQLQRYDGSLEVTALHIKLLGGKTTGALGSGDVKLASVTCGPSKERAPEAPPKPEGPGQVVVVPAGAPQTGDGSLATEG
ncbi:choice-of-anchor P family protein [Amycolatopsis sp. OK19-0408]|uniref:Choice-of-anchor P family protein n=1 Tax=Amycolatopsis iheyensis TaxID=2945988 RepID=A0A9X2SNW4_9PSEU|nr:choice-of-anchor P family protein [Amycolatopsis iheyensis]MCR6487526.1 choice-of-anchor P family protein [Amycolatopsis iheyensis]